MFRENSIQTCILSRVKQISSPVSMHETSARTWCSGKTRRDRVEREVGGGIGMANTCKSMAKNIKKERSKKQREKKISYIMVKRILFKGCKDSSIFSHQSM